MNRLIDFRGKSIKNGSWIYGDLIHGIEEKKGRVFIMPREPWHVSVPRFNPLEGVEVDASTIGQFTEMYDKSNIGIYEGDIVEFTNLDLPFMEVQFDDGSFYLIRKDPFTYKGLKKEDIEGAVDVIGNIHDNPELLKGGEK